MTTADIRPLNDELRKVAQDELNEVEDRIGKDIDTLRAWLEKQPHLKSRLDDQFLVSFLRGCKYSLEKAKSKIDYFYTIKTMVPELFANQTMDEKTRDFCRTGTYVHLPKTLGDGGPRIQLINCSNFDHMVYSSLDFLRFQFLLMYWSLYNDDNFTISGFIYILDLDKVHLSFMTQFEPMLLMKIRLFVEKTMAARIKGIHIINCPREAQAVLSFTKSLMGKKINQRLYLHKSLEDLYKVIPKENLPTEYGGTNGTISELTEQLEQKLVAFNDYLAEEDQFGVNEKLRPGKMFDKDSLFGIDGSFRNLDID